MLSSFCSCWGRNESESTPPGCITVVFFKVTVALFFLLAQRDLLWFPHLLLLLLLFLLLLLLLLLLLGVSTPRNTYRKLEWCLGHRHSQSLVWGPGRPNIFMQALNQVWKQHMPQTTLAYPSKILVRVKPAVASIPVGIIGIVAPQTS